MPTTVMACGSSSRGTTSTMAEFHDGDSMAVQQPVTKVSSSSVAGPAQPMNISTANSVTTTACTLSDARIRRRLSVVSAITPAGSESRNMGRKTAVCTSAARNELPVSSTISQAVAMACMALPTKYTVPPLTSARKGRCRSVALMESVPAVMPTLSGLAQIGPALFSPAPFSQAPFSQALFSPASPRDAPSAPAT